MHTINPPGQPVFDPQAGAKNMAGDEPSLIAATCALIKAEPYWMTCLAAVRTLRLPQAMIGAGFVRNLIWDALHQRQPRGRLNDVDVVFFDPADISKEHEQTIEQQLSAWVPGTTWQVRNQARMHMLHDCEPFTSTRAGIDRWVEKETCVAVALAPNNELAVYAPYGIRHNWAGIISINPRYPRPELYRQRVAQKQWLKHWPQLTAQWPQNGAAE